MAEKMSLYYDHYASPVGQLLLAADEEGLRFLLFEGEHQAEVSQREQLTRDPALFGDVRKQLDAYFGGELKRFSLRLAPQGTAFQKETWMALREIPYGQTCSYSDIAHRINRPKAVRAVGAANGQNPISIIVPCHRVIGKNGTLVGFGGGLPVKQWLLRHEAEHGDDLLSPKVQKSA